MEGTTGATGDLFWVIFFGSSPYLLLFLPGLELAIWYREDTIPDPTSAVVRVRKPGNPRWARKREEAGHD